MGNFPQIIIEILVVYLMHTNASSLLLLDFRGSILQLFNSIVEEMRLTLSINFSVTKYTLIKLVCVPLLPFTRNIRLKSIAGKALDLVERGTVTAVRGSL